MQYTTIRVSKATLKLLESYKEKIGAKSFDEAIRRLVNEYRRALVEKYYGVDRGRLGEFTEEDRLEDREV